jgi:hypothetical protein
LEAGDALVAPFLAYAGDDVTLSVVELAESAVYVPAHARHLDVLAGLPFAYEGIFPVISDVRKHDKPVPQIRMLIQFRFKLHQSLNVVQAIGLSRLRSCRRVRRQRQSSHRERKQVIRKIRVEDQQCLARDTERQFHSRKHYELLFLRQRLPAAVRFVRCGTAHVGNKRHIVVIGYSDTLDARIAAGLYQAGGIFPPRIIRDTLRSGPIEVARRVDLKVQR